MRRLMQLNQKKIDLETLSKLYKVESYGLLYEKVMALVKAGGLVPIKNSGLNGKSPALYKRYRIVAPQKDMTRYEEELNYNMSTLLDVTYYLKHLEQYEEDRENIMLLNQYLKQRDGNEDFISLNERSFEIWGREKYLKQEGGMILLRRLGLSLEVLRVYETVPPVAYYVQHKKVPQTVLIVENMDTFYSMRQHLMKGKQEIAGVEIGTLVYGAGKQIVKGFENFIMLGESYLQDKDNVFLYFGDLDYEGISIYESLKKRAEQLCPIVLFTALYERMLDKSQQMQLPLPQTKEKQNRVEITDFLQNFEVARQQVIQVILGADEYIPQEILNGKDF